MLSALFMRPAERPDSKKVRARVRDRSRKQSGTEGRIRYKAYKHRILAAGYRVNSVSGCEPLTPSGYPVRTRRSKIRRALAPDVDQLSFRIEPPFADTFLPGQPTCFSPAPYGAVIKDVDGFPKNVEASAQANAPREDVVKNVRHGDRQGQLNSLKKSHRLNDKRKGRVCALKPF